MGVEPSSIPPPGSFSVTCVSRRTAPVTPCRTDTKDPFTWGRGVCGGTHLAPQTQVPRCLFLKYVLTRKGPFDGTGVPRRDTVPPTLSSFPLVHAVVLLSSIWIPPVPPANNGEGRKEESEDRLKNDHQSSVSLRPPFLRNGHFTTYIHIYFRDAVLEPGDRGDVSEDKQRPLPYPLRCPPLKSVSF